MAKKPDQGVLTAEAYEKAAARKTPLHYTLKLFVTGMTLRSRAAILNVRNFCDTHLAGRYGLEVVDLYQHPISAKDNQIIAAPTLVRESPLPVRRFVGDLAQAEKILAGLG